MRKPYQSPGRIKNSSYYIAPVGDWTHDLSHTVASNMVKVSHALNHSATKVVMQGMMDRWLIAIIFLSTLSCFWLQPTASTSNNITPYSVSSPPSTWVNGPRCQTITQRQRHQHIGCCPRVKRHNMAGLGHTTSPTLNRTVSVHVQCTGHNARTGWIL